MKEIMISCHLGDSTEPIDKAEFAFINDKTANHVAQFHRSLPNYEATPLVKLPGLASYAIAKYLGGILGLGDDELQFNKILGQKAKYENTTFVTATDGNHGRAVAWSAKLFGCKAVVYMPQGSSPVRLEAIKELGAEASITTMNYDDTVIHANQKALEKGWILLQDTAWEGYQDIPIHIMQG